MAAVSGVPSSDESASTQARRLAMRPAASRFPFRTVKPRHAAAVRRLAAALFGRATEKEASCGVIRQRGGCLSSPSPGATAGCTARVFSIALVPLKSFVSTHASFVQGDGVEPSIEVEIKPRANGRAICSGFGQKRPGYDRLAARRFEFVPLWTIALFFASALRRVDCPKCGATAASRRSR